MASNGGPPAPVFRRGSSRRTGKGDAGRGRERQFVVAGRGPGRSFPSQHFKIMSATVRTPESLAGHSAVGSFILRGVGGQLSPHFRASEFACPCEDCTRIAVHWALVELLQRMRWRIGRPIFVTSGFRCAAYNAEIGGAPGSLHVHGLAADLQSPGIEPQALADIAENCGAGGIGLYPRHIHVDVGEERRWTDNYG